MLKIKNIIALACGCLIFLAFALPAGARTETKAVFPKGKTTMSANAQNIKFTKKRFVSRAAAIR